MDLLAFERKLDQTIARKRMEIQEAIKKPIMVSLQDRALTKGHFDRPFRLDQALPHHKFITLQILVLVKKRHDKMFDLWQMITVSDTLSDKHINSVTSFH